MRKGGTQDPSRDTVYGEIMECDMLPEDEVKAGPVLPDRDSTYNQPFEQTRITELQRSTSSCLSGVASRREMFESRKSATMPTNRGRTPRQGKANTGMLVKGRLVAFAEESTETTRTRRIKAAKLIDDEYLTTVGAHDLLEATGECKNSTTQSPPRTYANIATSETCGGTPTLCRPTHVKHMAVENEYLTPEQIRASSDTQDKGYVSATIHGGTTTLASKKLPSQRNASSEGSNAYLVMTGPNAHDGSSEYVNTGAAVDQLRGKESSDRTNRVHEDTADRTNRVHEDTADIQPGTVKNTKALFNQVT